MEAMMIGIVLFVAAGFMIKGLGASANAASNARMRKYYDEHPEKAEARKLMREAGYDV